MKTITFRNHLHVAFILLFILGITSITFSQNWYNSSWEFRKSHVISGSAGAGTNYQVRIVAHKGPGTDNGHDVYMGSNVLDNFGDVRFTASDGTTLLSYWLETGSLASGSQAAFWVEVAADLGTTQTIFVYYGNSSATTTSDGAGTFILFDDFTGTTLDGAKWTKQNGGTPSFASGLMTISSNTVDPSKIIATGGPQTNNNAIGARFRVTGGINADERAGVGVRTTNSATPTGYNYLFRNFSAGNLNTIQFLDDGIAWGTATTFAWAKNTFYTMEAFHDGTTLRGRTNYGTWSSQAGWTTRTGYLALNIGSFDATTAWDWAFIRKCIASEPAHSTWGAQDPPSSPAVFNGSGTFTVPVGVTSLTVEAWGGGGKGSTGTSDGEYGGGGGGAYARSILTVNPGDIYNIVVGSGSTTTAAGGSSSFNLLPSGPNLVLAVGGNSVANNTQAGALGGTAASSIGNDYKSNGGRGGSGSTNNFGGGGGSSGGTASNGNYVNATTTSTGGTVTGGGSGANGPTTDDTPGNPGLIPGGGGSGPRRNNGTQNGGNGANGQITITWIACVPPAAPGVTSPVNYCLNATASPLTATGSNLLWYTTPTGGTGSSTAPTPSTTTAGTTSYYVSQTIGCESPRAQIDVIVYAPVATVNGQSNISCFGGNDGSITIHASGGISPYSYSVDNGFTWISSGTDPYVYGGLNVAEGPYEVRVKDSLGCLSPAIP